MSFNKTKMGSTRPEKCAKCEHRVPLVSIDEYTRTVKMGIKDPISPDATFCRCTCMAGKRPELPAIYPKNFVNLHSYHDSEGAYGRQWIGKMI